MAANRFPSVAGPSSREEIVSSLISLSENRCEKAMELQTDNAEGKVEQLI